MGGCPYDDTYQHVAPLWCGARPCDWTVDEGEVRPGPTWHTEDPSLELVSERVRLSLRIEALADARCTGLSLLADTTGALLLLELDVGDDGSIEHSLVVSGDRFQRQIHAVDPQRFVLPAPVRFILRKEGRYPVRLADIRLHCVSAPRAAP